MKKIFYIGIAIALLSSQIGCKKFLNLNPPSDLSGNNFWQTQEDVEHFTNGMYELFRKSISRPDMTVSPSVNGGTEFAYLPFSGDLRGAPVHDNEVGFGRYYYEALANNNIREIENPNPSSLPPYNWYTVFNFKRFTQWDKFFRVIASANISVAEIPDVPDSKLTEVSRKSYIAEAVFLRCLCYFFMVRQFGDVPYYTDAFHSEPLIRMDMVKVLQNCVKDLDAVKEDLPWTYDDPVFRAVRAMRGSALALLMHMNMWLASFDETQKQSYYEAVDALGDELRDQNNGAYQLLPLERSGEIFKGRSKEGLFEVPQNANYGESFGWSSIHDFLEYSLPGLGTRTSQMYYDPKFIYFLYPKGEPDKRAQLWFDPATLYSYVNDPETFRMRKFLVSSDPKAIDGFGFDASQIIFRYAGAILTQAEAVAKMGNDGKAQMLANIVRDRAAATPFTTTGKDLQNDIFYEQSRELMGEGHYWYDVVRTRRIIDNDYKFGYHSSVQQYKDGCWTWPIDPDVRLNNPGITLNDYWR